MPKRTAEITIDRSADEVWATIGDFAVLAWNPTVEWYRADGEHRTAKSVGVELEIDERLVDHDDGRRTFSYAITGLRGVTQFDLGDGATLDLDTMCDHSLARLTVVPLDDSSCRVTYDLELDEGHDQTLEATSGQYQSVLAHLKAQMER